MKKVAIAIFCLLFIFFSFAQDENNKSIFAYMAKYKNDKLCAISYTFDDGLLEHYTLVAPELEKNGFRGTFWIWGKCIDNENASLGKPRMTWAQLKEMSEKGHEISSHSWSHSNLIRISLDSLKVEIEKNDSIIFQELGKMPRTFCYPGNAMNKVVVEMASKNRVGTRTSQTAVGSRSTEESLDRWVNELIEKGDWGVTMTHGITYGYDSFPDPSILWRHFEKVKSLSDRIWVATFEEVAAYTRERENIQTEIIETSHSIFITPHLSLNKELFTEELTMVIKREGRKKIRVRQDKKKLTVTVLPDKLKFNFNPYGGIIQVSFR